MNRRGLSLIEMIVAIGITSVVCAAIASMMAAASNSLSSRDDGRRSALRLATTQVRLGAYIAPSRCILDDSDTHLTLWFEDNAGSISDGGGEEEDLNSEEENAGSNTVHASEIRWIEFDSNNKTLSVSFVDFPEGWSQEKVDEANTECDSDTDYEDLFNRFEDDNLTDSIVLVDLIATCNFWTNNNDPSEATRVSIRFSLETETGQTTDSFIEETIRHHQFPLEQE